MVTTGQPALLPWTSPGLVPMGQQAFKPRAGNAPLSAGKSFARAVASVPGVKVAALDVASGYLVASGDLTLRDDLLAMIARDAARTAYWYELAAGAVPTHAYCRPVAMVANGSLLTGEFFGEQLPEGHSATWSLRSASAWTFGECLMLGERVDTFLARSAGAVGLGTVLYLGGTGSLDVPLPLNTGSLAIALPALCLYGVFGEPETMNPDALAALALRLVCAAPLAPAAASLFAACADRESFRTTTWPAAPAAEPWDTTGAWPARRAWCAAVVTDTTWESGKVPVWLNQPEENIVVASQPHRSANTPPAWTEDNDETLLATSQFSGDDVAVEFDNV